MIEGSWKKNHFDVYVTVCLRNIYIIHTFTHTHTHTYIYTHIIYIYIIYIYIYLYIYVYACVLCVCVYLFTFSHLADAFIHNLQMRTIEAIKTNKRAMICKCYNKSQLA